MKEIFLTGNTIDKKRTYSNLVSFFLDEIQSDFNIMGLNEAEHLERFEKGKIYEAILVKRK